MSALFLVMIIAGMAMLGRSLISLRAMLGLIGAGSLRSGWIALVWLIVAFLIGYSYFAWLRESTEIRASDLVVALILMAGGAFVLVVARLSCQTAHDIGRIAALERDVILDPLTGIFNRRYLSARLDEEVLRARRYKLPLSVLLVDFDHFKQINDTYGHQFGDLVLRRICQLIARVSRPGDNVARYGGEEIVVVAPHSTSESVSAFAERLRGIIAREGIAHPNGDHVRITVSIGTAALNDDDSSATLLQRADGALYTAKREGRNRVCKAIPMPSRIAA